VTERRPGTRSRSPSKVGGYPRYLGCTTGIPAFGAGPSTGRPGQRSDTWTHNIVSLVGSHFVRMFDLYQEEAGWGYPASS
jgi:hypothetical protein